MNPAGATPPTLTAVIPSTGRPELARAISSARGQRAVRVQLVVVVDGAPGSVADQLLEGADQVLWTGGRRGASHARNLGVSVADGAWIGFLDDDDEWMPEKSQYQLRAAAQSGIGLPVMSSRHTHVEVQTQRESAPLPRRLIRVDERVDEYLFRRRRPAGGRASIYTSTLLMPRNLAVNLPWDESLSRHQDWDLLVRAFDCGAVIVQVPEPLVRIQVGSTASISADDSWQPSLQWADRVLRSSSDSAVYADFVTAQVLRYAIFSRSPRGIMTAMSRLLKNRRMPSIGPIIIAIGGLLPRAVVNRILTRTR